MRILSIDPLGVKAQSIMGGLGLALERWFLQSRETDIQAKRFPMITLMQTLKISESNVEFVSLEVDHKPHLARRKRLRGRHAPFSCNVPDDLR